jgi:GNAT superfamily N-acetyltransferase
MSATTSSGCIISDVEEKKEKIREFLRTYGDDLPESAIENAVSDAVIDNWVIECDENGKIISGVTYINNDWYLCTIHYLATDKNFRGRGLGKKVTEEVLRKMMSNQNCKVVTADVTYDNAPSIAVAEKYGFKKVNQFCWMHGQKPAYIMQYVPNKPTTGMECK